LSIVEAPGCKSSELHVMLLVERDDDNVHLLVNSFLLVVAATEI
jgi:hypothetical protein